MSDQLNNFITEADSYEIDEHFLESGSDVLIHKLLHNSSAPLFVLMFPMVCFSSSYAQNYRSLISEAIYVESIGEFADKSIWVHIPDLRQGSFEYHDSNIIGLENLLKKDVLAYYDLEEKYNTELKKKIFFSSQEAKNLKNELEEFYNEVITKDFYFLYEMGGSYNLSTKKFHTGVSINELGPPNYLSISRNFQISLPNTVSLYSGYFPFEKYISIPLNSEDIALEIENNIEDCALLVVFKFEKIIKGKTYYDIISGKLKYTYIVNKETGKIYSDNPEIRKLEKQHQEAGESVQIKGTLSGTSSEMIYLNELGNGSTSGSDAVQLDVKGNFSFKQKISQPTFYSLTVNDRAITLLAHPGEELVITGDARHLPLTYSAEGNEDSKHIRSLSQRLEHTVFVGDSLDRCLQNYIGNQDSVNIRRQFERIYINEVDSLRAYNIRFINQNPQSLVVIYALYQQLGQNDYLFNQEDDIKYFRKADSIFYKRFPKVPYVEMLHANVVSMNEQMSLRNH